MKALYRKLGVSATAAVFSIALLIFVEHAATVPPPAAALAIAPSLAQAGLSSGATQLYPRMNCGGGADACLSLVPAQPPAIEVFDQLITFTISISQDISGTAYGFSLLLAGDISTTYAAELLLSDQLLASAQFTPTTPTHERFTQYVTGLDPALQPSGVLALRLQRLSGVGSLLIGSPPDQDSFIVIPPLVEPLEPPTATSTPTMTPTNTPTPSATPTPPRTYLPIVLRQPTPTPTFTPTFTPSPTSPPYANVYVNNRTGGELCYEVRNTGIGRRCFASGVHHYGDFLAGVYSWRASARCGSASGSEYYSAGYQEHNFWCSSVTASPPSTMLEHLGQ